MPLVPHRLQQRLQRGAAHPSAQFVTGTRAGQLLRVQMAPVRAIDAPPGEVSLNGFVLMLENITRDFADESDRDTLLHGLTEGSRASLGNLQAAVEMLRAQGAIVGWTATSAQLIPALAALPAAQG